MEPVVAESEFGDIRRWPGQGWSPSGSVVVIAASFFVTWQGPCMLDWIRMGGGVHGAHCGSHARGPVPLGTTARMGTGPRAWGPQCAPMGPSYIQMAPVVFYAAQPIASLDTLVMKSSRWFRRRRAIGLDSANCSSTSIFFGTFSYHFNGFCKFVSQSKPSVIARKQNKLIAHVRYIFLYRWPWPEISADSGKIWAPPSAVRTRRRPARTRNDTKRSVWLFSKFRVDKNVLVVVASESILEHIESMYGRTILVICELSNVSVMYALKSHCFVFDVKSSYCQVNCQVIVTVDCEDFDVKNEGQP